MECLLSLTSGTNTKPNNSTTTKRRKKRKETHRETTFYGAFVSRIYFDANVTEKPCSTLTTRIQNKANAKVFRALKNDSFLYPFSSAAVDGGYA